MPHTIYMQISTIQLNRSSATFNTTQEGMYAAVLYNTTQMEQREDNDYTQMTFCCMTKFTAKNSICSISKISRHQAGKLQAGALFF